MKSVKTQIAEKAKADVLDKLCGQVGAVETFLTEVCKTDKLNETDLGNRYEVTVGQNAAYIEVKDRGLNLALFTIRNRFLKVKDTVKVLSEVSYGMLDKTRFPETVKALTEVNWVESHSN